MTHPTHSDKEIDAKLKRLLDRAAQQPCSYIMLFREAMEIASEQFQRAITAEARLTAAAEAGKCKKCGGLGYLVGDAEWEPYAVQCPECSTAAAEVGESTTTQIFRQSIKDEVASVARDVETTTIERCTQVAIAALRKHLGDDEYSQGMRAGAEQQMLECVAAIRALKDQP